MEDSKEHEIILRGNYECELEKTLGNVHDIQEMMLGQSKKFEPENTIELKKRKPVVKAYIEETKSPGILSIKSPVVNSSKSVP